MKPLNKILLIDDDYISNAITRALMESLGICHRVQVALNGKEGLDILKAGCFLTAAACPDLIMLDINMPVMNGFEFLQKFDESQSAIKPTVVMYTSSDDPRDMEKAARFENVAGFMTKPFEPQKLQTILDKLD